MNTNNTTQRNGLSKAQEAMLTQLAELLKHGYGRLEITVQDSKVVTVQITKTTRI